MLKNLVKIAAELDSAGFKKEADIVDLIIRKVAMSEYSDSEEDNADDVAASSSEASDDDFEQILSDLADQETDEKNAEEELPEYGEESDEDEEWEEPSEEDVREWESREELAGRRFPRWTQS